MKREPKRGWLGMAGVVALITLGGCQDYGFEELPPSVSRQKRRTIVVDVSSEVDILFVMDNSGSMVGEQKAIAESFSQFVGTIDEKFGENKYRIAVITTGMESPNCGQCPPDDPRSCMNETGETGRFQDRLGKNTGTVDNPIYDFETNADCRVIDPINRDNLWCFYDSAEQRGSILVGVNGCGFERGLEAMRSALDEPLINAWNKDFLRPDATLAVIVITDEEDCGKVGEVDELGVYVADVCYYASNGKGPDGATQDPNGNPFRLTPVRDYYEFLVGLKQGRKGLIKFAAIVGVEDESNPLATTIGFESEAPNAKPESACTTPNCTGQYCRAFPGVRYIALADMFGIGENGNGFVDTICQENFSETMEELGTFVSCPREFKLTEKILDPGLANILLNDVAVPRFSCDNKDRLEECTGLTDTTCSGGRDCLETWSYTPPGEPPDPKALGGTITFAEHYDPCELIEVGEIRIELIYVTD